MASKNNLHLKQTKTADRTPHYGLRKLSVGVASVLLSTTLYLGTTAQADTVPTGDESQNTAVSSVADSAGSSSGTLMLAQSAGSTADTQSTTYSAASQATSNSSAAIGRNTESTASASSASESTANNQNTVTSAVASSADQTAEPAVNTVSVSDSATTTLDLSSSAADLVTDSALTTSLTTSTAVDTTANTETPDISKWTYNVVPNGTANEIVLTGYTGTDSTIIVPNAVDFANAGASISNGTVYLTYDLTRKLATTSGVTKLIISSNGDAKVVACGNSDPANSLIIGDADWHGAFLGTTLSSMDLRGLDTSQVTNMRNMFADDSNLTSLDASNWDTSKVTDIGGMFNNCNNLTFLNVSNWDTSKVTDMGYTFNGCNNLTSLDTSEWDTSKVTNMCGIFTGCSNLTSLDVLNWDTSKVTNMAAMFGGCSKLTSLDVSKWNTSSVTNVRNMFAGDSNLTFLDVSKWNTSNVTDMGGMFNNCNNLTSLDVLKWDTSKVTDMGYMFNCCSNLISLDASEWDTSKVTNMRGIFTDCSNLTSLNVSNWDTSKVTNMNVMFDGCSKLTSLDLSNWNTSKTTDMSSMFYVEFYVPLEVITKDSRLLAYDYVSDNRASKLQFKADADDATLSSNNAQTDSKTLTVAYTPEQANNSTLTSKIDQLADDSTNNYQQLAKTYQATIKANPGLSAELAAAFDAVSNESATRPNYGLVAFNPTDATLGQVAALTSLLNGTYTAEWKKAAKSTVEFVDDDNNGAVVGTPVVLNGYVDDVKSVSMALPASYELVSGQTIPTSVTLSGANDTVQIHLKHQIQTIADNDPMNHTAFRVTVHYKKDGQTNTFMPDTVITTKYKRTTTKDLVTGKYTATPFVLDSITQTGTKIDGLGTPAEGVVKDVPKGWQYFTYSIPYNISVPGWHQVLSGSSFTDMIGVAAGTSAAMKTAELTAIYAANTQTTHIKYVDANGTTVKTDTVSGKTGTTQTVNSTVPVGWKMTTPQTIPTSVTFDDNGIPDTTITIEHDHVAVSHDKPQTTGTQIPNGAAKFKGVANSDLNKTVTRTVTITSPNGKAKTTTQTFTSTRDAVVDMVDGSVVYSDWTQGKWDAVDVPVYDHYTVSQTSVPEQTVNGSTADSTVNVTYTANTETVTVQWVDDTEDGKVVYSTNVSLQPGRKTDVWVFGLDENGHASTDAVALSGMYNLVSVSDTNVLQSTNWPGYYNVFDLVMPSVDKWIDGNTYTVHLTHKISATDGYSSPTKIALRTTNSERYPNLMYTDDAAWSKTHKDVLRTITVVKPDGSQSTTTQKLAFSRQAQYDMVTGEFKGYTDWKEGTQTFAAYTPVAIAGYTAGTVPTATATGDYDNLKATVGYMANAQTAKIVYVDKDGNTIKTDTINGVTDQTVSVNSTVPAGWRLSTGQMIPATIKLSANTPDTKIIVEHDHVTITPDNPQTDGTDIPNGTAQFKGVSENDLNQTLARTITVNDPHKGTQTITQTAKISRNATVDMVDGTVKYGDWSTAEWPAYAVPTVDGYTPNQATVESKTITDGDKDVAVTINYTADKQTAKIVYADENGNAVKTDTVAGVTDQTVDTNSSVPVGWKLIDGQTIPAMIKLGVNTPDVMVKIQHDHVSINHDKPQADGTDIPGGAAKFNGVSDTDLNQTLTRTITVADPYKGNQTTVQTAKIHRNATVDMVDGTVKYGDWSTAKWPEYVAPIIAGYTPSQATVAEKPIANGDQDDTVTISYTADKQTAKIVYVDENGNAVKTDSINGVTDQTVNTNSSVPTGWKLVDGQTIPTTIKLGVNTPDTMVKVEHDHVSISHDKSQTDGTDIPGGTAKFKGVSENNLNQTLTRTITINDPHAGTKTITQTAKISRDATVDMVDGSVVYGDWSTAQWPEYSVPTVDGYTPSQKAVEAKTITNGDQDVAVTINYMADKQTAKIVYTDADDNPVKTDTVEGVTDQIVDASSTVPTGWKLVDGQTIPTTIKLGVNTPDTVIKIQHDHVSINHDKPQANGTDIPGGTAKFNGVADNDLNQTLTRTITVNNPYEGTKTITQTAKIYRAAVVDMVDGSVEYGEWSTTEWPKYTVPTVDGYTPSQAVVEKKTVANGDKDTAVTINYTADKQTTHVVYVDADDNPVKTDTVEGVTDQTVDTNSTVPTGWKLVDGQTVPVTIKLGVNTPDTVVKVQHAHVTVTPDAPKTVNDKLPDNADKTFPSGVAHDDLNQMFERTITIAKPDGTTNTVHQTAHFTRTADVDEVSGAVAYSDWTTMDRFDSYVVPAIPGYTASQVAIAQSTPIFGDNPIVEINYTANAQTAKIVYVDENGNVIKADTVNGVTDQTVDTNSSVPTGWKLVDGQTIPTTIKLGVNMPDTVVKIQHDHVSINHDKPQADGSNIPGGTAKFSGVSDNDLNQTLTRTITINDPYAGAKTIMQTAKISRNATVDMVDGSVKYGDWSTAEWPAYTVPTVDGYTPSQATIESKAVADGDKDDVVTIDYKADKQTAKIVYVDENGNVVKADTVSGKTDQIVDVNSSVPVGWKLADGQTMPVKIKLNVNTPDTIVKVEHNHVSINYDKPQTDGTSIPGGAAEFKGVADNDLNQTLTRTIIVKMPNGQTKALAQTAKLSRDAVVDMVDGTVKYGDWSTTQWNEYTAPVVDGYTPSQAVVEAESVINGMQNKLVTIDYTANDGTQTINYVDEDGNVIVNQTIHGKTDQEIAVNDDKPHGWVLENGQTVPGTVTIKAVDEPITVKIKHGIVAVAPDAPKTDADRMPNWPDKRYPAGVGYDDLNKTVTRTITFELPDGQTKTIKQTITFTRHATVDEVTNAVVYSAWNEQSHTFDVVDVPTIDGWTASVEQVDGTIVMPDSEDEQVTVAYTVNPTAPKSEDKSADTPGQSEAANGSANTVFNESTTIQENDKTDSQAKANSQAKTDELPQTGNEQTNLQALAGLAMTGLAAMLGLGRKKRKNS